MNCCLPRADIGRIGGRYREPTGVLVVFDERVFDERRIHATTCDVRCVKAPSTRSGTPFCRPVARHGTPLPTVYCLLSTERGLQLAPFFELGQDVAAADELAVDERLGDRFPAAVGRQGGSILVE